MSASNRALPSSLPLSAAIRAAIEVRREAARFADERPALEALLERATQGDPGALAELEDAFSGTVPIGTGGRRGTCGPGPNRMNPALMRETAQGLADALRAEDLPRRVAIAYDTRRDSRMLARVVAEQLARNDIRVVLIDAPRPTPLLSFAVRYWGCGAGVVISASHNPPSDNGIKIYGPDGAQVLGDRDRRLMQAIEAAASSSLPEGPAPASLIEILDTPAALEALDLPYIEDVLCQGVTRRDLGATGLSVVYSPFHGVGHTEVLPVLARRGLRPEVVASQMPDGGVFATLPSANPEQPNAFAEALRQAGDADLVIVNDPDADRLGAMARDADGRLTFIDGNRIGVLLLDHVLRRSDVPPEGWVLTTIVTTPLVATVARAQGVMVIDDLLVGFKHHAGMLGEAPKRPCVLACEESHGYLRGDNVRDKDGVMAALLLCEAAAEAKAVGERLLGRLDALWSTHGYHREQTANLFARGVAGREAIARLMAIWRAQPPDAFGNMRVTRVEDRLTPRDTGSPTRDLLSDVLIFELAPHEGLRGRLVVRPSGTEPKAKIYALLRSAPCDPAVLPGLRASVDRRTEELLGLARERAESVMGAVDGV